MRVTADGRETKDRKTYEVQATGDVGHPKAGTPHNNQGFFSAESLP
jgi:hypothetical protein